LVDTGASAVIGLIVGAVVAALMNLLSFVREVIRRPHRGKALVLTPSRPENRSGSNEPD
jgi:uncharacterized membrane protein